MASDKFKSVNIYFPDEDKDLYEWVKGQGKGNDSYLGREAFECYRYFDGNLTEAQDARRALTKLQQLYPKKWQELIKDGE